MAHDERAARSILDALDLPSAEVRSLGFGLSSEAWLVNAAGPDLVLRVATDPGLPPSTYPAEHTIMARLGAAGASVPAPVRGSWEVEGWSGPAFSLTTFVAGAPLNPSVDGPATGQIAAFLRLLHSIPVAGFGPVTPERGPVDGAAPLRGVAVDRAAGLRAWMGGAPLWPFDASRLESHPALVDRPELRARIAARRGLVERAGLAGPAALVHSDLHEENVLADPAPGPGSVDGVRLGFIDFGEAFIGSPDWDVAALAYFLGWPLAEAVLVGVLADPAHEPVRRRSVAALGLSFGLYRWWQDRQRGIDEESHDEAFIGDSLDRMT